MLIVVANTERALEDPLDLGRPLDNMQRLYVLFFIELGSRRVHIAGCTPNPSAPWVTQQARQLMWTLAERPERIRFLIRDRDQKFTKALTTCFEARASNIIRTLFRASQANGVAERFVRTIRSECLDWLLILNQQQLERALALDVSAADQVWSSASARRDDRCSKLPLTVRPAPAHQRS